MHAGLAALHVAIGHYSAEGKVDLAGGQVITYDMCSALDETGDGLLSMFQGCTGSLHVTLSKCSHEIKIIDL